MYPLTTNFDKNDFNVQKNMTGAQLDKTVMAEPKNKNSQLSIRRKFLVFI